MQINGNLSSEAAKTTNEGRPNGAAFFIECEGATSPRRFPQIHTGSVP